MKKKKNDLGKRIFRVRSHFGLTQANFGILLGVTGRYVSMLENGKREPSESLKKLICRMYQVGESWLNTGYGKRGFVMYYGIDNRESDGDIVRFS